MDVSLLLALGAGLLSFASPCVLPLAPVYIGYLGGQIAATEEGAASRWQVFLHGLFFVLGFTVIFVALGAAASGIGRLLFAFQGVFTKVGGAVIILFGLHTLGVLKIPFLYRDVRRDYRRRPELGYLSSALMGFFFGAGWTPCVGPTLGTILTLALSEATVGRGALLLFVYSLGLGIPFLLLALGLDRAQGILQRGRRAMRALTIVSGILLILIGLLLFTDSLGWLYRLVPAFEPSI